MEHLRRMASSSVSALRRAAQRLRTRAARRWQWHWTRVAEEHGYAEALTSVLLEAIALLTPSMRLRYLAHELLAAYVAVLRTLRRPPLSGGEVI